MGRRLAHGSWSMSVHVMKFCMLLYALGREYIDIIYNVHENVSPVQSRLPFSTCVTTFSKIVEEKPTLVLRFTRKQIITLHDIFSGRTNSDRNNEMWSRRLC